MELVDIYNDKHEKLNYTKGRKELSLMENLDYLALFGLLMIMMNY